MKNAETKSYTYSIVNPQTDEIMETVNSRDVYERYGIRNVVKFISESENGMLPDGNILREYDKVRCKRLFADDSSVYYVYQDGHLVYVPRNVPSGHARNRHSVETYNDSEGNLCFNVGGQKFNVAECVINCFVSHPPKHYRLLFKDKDKNNCSYSNLLIKPVAEGNKRRVR